MSILILFIHRSNLDNFNRHLLMALPTISWRKLIMKVTKLFTALASVAALGSIALSSGIALAGTLPIVPGAKEAVYRVNNVQLKCIHSGASTPVVTTLLIKDDMTDGQIAKIPPHLLGLNGDEYMEFSLVDFDGNDPFGGKDDIIGGNINEVQFGPRNYNMAAQTRKHITQTIKGSGSTYQLDFDLDRIDSGVRTF
jgi:hypothetical protein